MPRHSSWCICVRWNCKSSREVNRAVHDSQPTVVLSTCACWRCRLSADRLVITRRHCRQTTPRRSWRHFPRHPVAAADTLRDFPRAPIAGVAESLACAGCPPVTPLHPAAVAAGWLEGWLHRTVVTRWLKRWSHVAGVSTCLVSGWLAAVTM